MNLVCTDLTPESAKTPGVDNEDDEEGLPSPPLDEGAFFANPASVEWSQVSYLCIFRVLFRKFFDQVFPHRLTWLYFRSCVALS